MKGKAHIPICQFGFLDLEIDETKTDEEVLVWFNDILIKAKDLTKPKSNKPKFLGQKMTENGHVYEAVMNESKKELYWLVQI